MAAIKKLTVSISELVDRIGRTKADIADLEKTEKRDVDTLKKKGVGEYAGTLFNANVFTQERGNTINWEALVKSMDHVASVKGLIKKYTERRTVTTTDWEAIARELEPTEAVIKKHTVVGQTITVCKVTAR